MLTSHTSTCVQVQNFSPFSSSVGAQSVHVSVCVRGNKTWQTMNIYYMLCRKSCLWSEARPKKAESEGRQWWAGRGAGRLVGKEELLSHIGVSSRLSDPGNFERSLKGSEGWTLRPCGWTVLQAEQSSLEPVEGSENNPRSGGLEQAKMEKKTQGTGTKQADKSSFWRALCGDHTEEEHGDQWGDWRI